MIKNAELELGVYETYEDLYGRRSTYEELSNDIIQFSMSSILWVCAQIINGAQVWDRRDPPLDVYISLVRQFFSPPLAARFTANYWRHDPKREVFHRRQLLLIAKIAIGYCKEDARDIRKNPSAFGSILLKANDQFHFNLLTQRNSRIQTKDDFARVLAEFASTSEYSKPRVAEQIVRNHLLLTRFTRALTSHIDFIDCALEFEQATGLTLAEWEALIFFTHTRFSRDSAVEAMHEPRALPLTTNQFSQSSIAFTKISAFLREVSNTVYGIRDSIHRRNFGTNDLTAFRACPMIRQWRDIGTTDQSIYYHLMDNHFLLEKQLGGPYWLAFSKYQERFPRFWGTVFEDYVSELLSRACSGTKARFLQNVRHPDNPNIQICDGMVLDEDSIAIIECKASIFTAAGKYSGDYLALANEIDSKLVYATTGENKKAVIQLAYAARSLLNDKALFESIDFPRSKLKRIFPIVITLDDIGGTLGISAYLDLAFSNACRDLRLERSQVAPLLCLDCHGVEYMTEFLHATTLPRLALQWLNFNPAGTVPFVAVPLGELSSRPNSWLTAEYAEMFKSTTRVLFPEIDADETFKKLHETKA